MRKLLSSPVQMPLSAAENQIYQNTLKYVTPLSLNLMAVKVLNRPEDFTGWCGEVIRLCREDLKIELLDDEQCAPLKKLEQTLEEGFTIGQCKMARIAPWPIFVDFIEEQSTLHALDERLRLLDYINKYCQKPLADLSIEDRLAFAGKHTKQHNYQTYDFDIEWFASTKGAKVFHALLEQYPEKFDAALSHIPLVGDVNYEHYQMFVNDFKQIIQAYTPKNPQGNTTQTKAPLAVASRLLAMRRPDQFIALNNNKIDLLCKGLSIVKFSNTDFSSYWHDMIGTLRTFPWWNQAKPLPLAESSSDSAIEISAKHDATSIEQGNHVASREFTLWNNRAILIDLFLFADPTLSQNSNYVRARDKALNKSVNKLQSKSRTTMRKNSIESIESLVDKALMAEDLPEYMVSKRDSIITQVKKGQSVDKAISLMRAIFG